MSSKRGQLFVVSAASGSGKSTLVDLVTARLSNTGRVITCTTRSPRGLEKNGVDYHFLSVEEFEQRINDGDFLEYALVHAGRLYGSSRSEIEPFLARGIDMFLVIDVQGAAQVRVSMPDAISVFVLPPSYAELAGRLRARAELEGVTDEADLAVRLATARHEVERLDEFTYVIVNDDVEHAAAALESIVVAERCRVAPQRQRIDSILATFKRGSASA